MDNKIKCRHQNYLTIGTDEKGKDILKCDVCYETITYQDLKTEFKTKSIAQILDEAKKDIIKPFFDYLSNDVISSDGDDETENADRLQDKIDEDRISNDLNL